MLLSLKWAWNFTTMNFISVRISYYYPLFTLGWEIKWNRKGRIKSFLSSYLQIHQPKSASQFSQPAQENVAGIGREIS